MEKKDSKRDNVDRCISCGEIIPEGDWFCPICRKKSEVKKSIDIESTYIYDRESGGGHYVRTKGGYTNEKD